MIELVKKKGMGRGELGVYFFLFFLFFIFHFLPFPRFALFLYLSYFRHSVFRRLLLCLNSV